MFGVLAKISNSDSIKRILNASQFGEKKKMDNGSRTYWDSCLRHINSINLIGKIANSDTISDW